jgi:hypothetical protein
MDITIRSKYILHPGYDYKLFIYHEDVKLWLLTDLNNDPYLVHMRLNPYLWKPDLQHQPMDNLLLYLDEIDIEFNKFRHNILSDPTFISESNAKYQKLNKTEYIMPIASGRVLDLRNGNIRDRQMEDYLTYHHPYHVRPNYNTCEIRNLLYQGIDKPDLLFRFLGYALTKLYNPEVGYHIQILDSWKWSAIWNIIGVKTYDDIQDQPWIICHRIPVPLTYTIVWDPKINISMSCKCLTEIRDIYHGDIFQLLIEEAQAYLKYGFEDVAEIIDSPPSSRCYLS